MNISDLFEKIAGKLTRNKNGIKKRQDILNEISGLSERVQFYINLFDDNKDLFANIAKTIDSNRMNTDKHYIQEYLLYRKRLTRKADNLEKLETFSSIIVTFKAISPFLTTLKDHIDKYINAPELNEHNLKISHVEILTILNVIRNLCAYFGYLLAGISKEVSRTFSKNNLKILPKYRLVFITNNNAAVAWVINKQIENNLFKDILNSINELKKNGKDLFIMDGEGGHNGQLANTLEIRANATTELTTSDSMFLQNPILLIGKAYQDILHWWRVRQLKEKEWMESRVSLLRMEMNNYDVESDEYIRLSNIADKYDILINEYDAKLSTYFIE